MEELVIDASESQNTFNQALILFLNELRVALTGAQLLVAFLLGLPFTTQFTRVDALDHHVYFLAFVSALASAMLLIAPSVFHRVHFNMEVRDRAKMMISFNRFAVAGCFFLAVAMTAVSFLVTRFIYQRDVALAVAAVAAASFGWFWFGLRSFHRHRSQA